MSRLVKPNEFWLKNYRPETRAPREPVAVPPLWVWTVVLGVLVGLCLVSLPSFKAYQSRPQDEFIRVNSERIRQFSQASEPETGSSFRVIALGNSFLHRATFLDSRMERLAEERELPGLRFLRVTRSNGRLSHFESLRDEIMDARPDLLLLQTGLLLAEPLLARVYPQFLRFWIRRQIDFPRGRYRPYPKVNHQTDEEIPRLWGRQDRAAFRHFALFFKKQYKKGWIDPDRLASWIDEALRKGVTILVLEMPRSIPVHTLAEQGSLKTFHEALPKQWNGVVLSYPVPLAIEHFTDFTHLNAQGRDVYSHWLLDSLKSFHHNAGSS